MATVSTTDSSKLLRSASTIVSSTESGQHLLKIDGYSLIKDTVTSGNYVQSRYFRVGGHDWHIRYYPNAYTSYWSEYISVEVGLDYYANVRAQVTFSLLDHQTGLPVPCYTNNYGVHLFNNSRVGGQFFIQKADLESSGHLRNNCFTIRCDLTVIKPPEAKDVDIARPTLPPPPVVSVPPSDLTHHLGGLLTTRKGADVTFEVDGKTFTAHRNVLAARSPVFHTKLFGLEEKEDDGVAGDAGAIISVDDMEAQDFEVLLHFIYTDSLPEIRGDEVAMLPDLVAAANRYKMERLRLVCEDKLCEYVNVRTVAAMLAFAGEHHCHGLMEKCLQLLDDPANLRNIVETEGLEYLTKSYPLVLKDLIAKFATKS